MCPIWSNNFTSRGTSWRKSCKHLKCETCIRIFIAESFIIVEMESWSTQGLTNTFYIGTQLHTADKNQSTGAIWISKTQCWMKKNQGE